MFSKRILVVLSVIWLSSAMLSAHANAVTTVTLNEPMNGNVFTTTNNVTFNCSVSSDDYIKWLNLYHDINGSFSFNLTKYFGEYGPDSYMSVLMHFNNETIANENDTHVFDWSGNGNNATVYGATFNATGGKFLGAYDFSGSYMEILGSGTNALDLYNGTIEMWIKPSSPITDEMSLLSKMQTCDSLSYALTITVDGFITFYLNSMGSSAYSPTAVIPDQWTHVAVAWNSTEIDFYINGAFTNKDESGISSNIVPNNENLIIGASRAGCDPAPFDGAVDELAIYRRMLTASEIEEHYNSTMDKNTSAEWAVTSVPDGTYKWNCLAYDSGYQSTWAAANSTFYVDMYSPPNVTSISLSPSSEDDLDPGVTINVTANITDPSNVSSAILYYGEDPNLDWNNITMANITMTNKSTSEWEASFNTSSGGDRIYYYMIWSNDTLGHQGNSTVYNVTVAKDYTWIINDSQFGYESGKVNTPGQLGILIINNTGDDTLIFNLTDNWNNVGFCGAGIDCEVYYNGSITYQFSLLNKSIRYVNITALFEDRDNEKNFTINISVRPSDFGRTATPSSRTINITMNSYTGGPYFSVSIVSPPLTVYQSQTFNLIAKVKNIGNETSNGTWLNWTLPGGWNLVSGNLSNNISMLSSGSTYWSNITVYADPSSANAGPYVLYANASCTQGVNGSAYAGIGVLCSNDDSICGSGCSYVTDDDCSIPSGGSTGGSTGLAMPAEKKSYEIILTIPGRLDINRGENKTLSIGAGNMVKGTELKNVYLSLSGYPQTFMKIAQPYINSIKYGETKYFEIEIRAPSYAVNNRYDLNVTVKGQFVEASKNTSAVKTSTISLITHRFIENKTLQYYEAAKESILEMEKSGLEKSKLEEIIDEIEKSLDEGNYDKVKELSESVVEAKNLAFELGNKINDLEKNIGIMKNQSVNLPETEKMLFLSKSAFQRGEYQRANERAESATLLYTFESGTAGYLIIVYNYWWLIILLALVFVFGARKARKRMSVSALNRKLDLLNVEENMIKKLILELQNEYTKGKIGAEKYRQMMERYENSFARTGKVRIDTLFKLKDMVSHEKAVTLLTNEEKRIRNSISDAQSSYFLHGKLGRDHYSRLMENAKNELFQVQGMAEDIRTENSKTKKGTSLPKAAAAAAAMLVLFLVAGMANAAENDKAAKAIEIAEKTIAEMQAMGFGVTYANDTLSEAKKLYDEGYYEGAESLASKILDIKEKAIKTNELINSVETKIYELSSMGYDISSASEIFDSGVSEFTLDNYVDAEAMMLEAMNRLDKIEAEESLKRVQQRSWVSETIMDYLWVLLVFALASVVIGFRLRGRAHVKKCRSEIKNLEAEREKIKKSITDIQTNYFKKGSMSRIDYELLIRNRNNRLSDINRNVSVLNERLKNH